MCIYPLHVLVQSLDNNNKINVGYKIFDFFSLLIISRKLVMYLAIFRKTVQSVHPIRKRCHCNSSFPELAILSSKGLSLFFRGYREINLNNTNVTNVDNVVHICINNAGYDAILVVYNYMRSINGIYLLGSIDQANQPSSKWNVCVSFVSREKEDTDNLTRYFFERNNEREEKR